MEANIDVKLREIKVGQEHLKRRNVSQPRTTEGISAIK
jgi:hypothetical protein